MTNRAPGPAFRERLTPSWWIYLGAVVIAAGLGLSVARIGEGAGLVTFAVSAVVLLWLLLRWTPLVVVDGETLRAGRARIPTSLLGSAEILDPAAMRRATGPGLDARAYLCLRGWISTGVRVALIDPQDPTPYWLVSTRRPVQLAAAIRVSSPPR